MSDFYAGLLLIVAMTCAAMAWSHVDTHTPASPSPGALPW